MAAEGFPETTRSQGQLRQHVPEGPASSRDLWGLTSCSPDPTREGLGHDWSDWAQLTAPATHAVLTSVLPLLIQTCSQVPRPRRVHQRPGAGPAILTTSNVLSFGRMCSVLPSHRPNPTSSELFLMRSPLHSCQIQGHLSSRPHAERGLCCSRRPHQVTPRAPVCMEASHVSYCFLDLYSFLRPLQYSLAGKL